MNIKFWIIEKWEWVKKWWKELVATVITGVLLAQVTPVPIPEILSFKVDGQTIELAYTDDNTGEDLIIRTNQSDFFNPFGNFTIYFSVFNASGKDQEIKTVFSFQDSSGDKKFVKNIGEYDGETTIENITPAYWKYSNEYSTASNEYIDKEIFIATTTEQIETTLWQKHTLNDFNVQAVSAITRKDIKNTHNLKENTFLLAKGETKFFRAKIAYTDFKDKEEFFIEAFGSLGAYGHLDPWTYEQLFNALNTAVLNGQDSWSTDANWEVVTAAAARYDAEGTGSGAKGVETANSNFQSFATRTISQVSDGIMYIAMKRTTGAANSFFTVYIDYDPNYANVNMRNNGYLSTEGGGTTWRAYNFDQWYVIALEFETTGTNQYRINTHDGTSWEGWSDWWNSGNSGAGPTEIRIYHGGGQSFQAWLDTITPTDPTVVAEEVVVPEFQWF